MGGLRTTVPILDMPVEDSVAVPADSEGAECESELSIIDTIWPMVRGPRMGRKARTGYSVPGGNWLFKSWVGQAQHAREIVIRQPVHNRVEAHSGFRKASRPSLKDLEYRHVPDWS